MKVAVNETRGLALNLDSHVALGNLSGPWFLISSFDGLQSYIRSVLI